MIDKTVILLFAGLVVAGLGVATFGPLFPACGVAGTWFVAVPCLISQWPGKPVWYPPPPRLRFLQVRAALVIALACTPGPVAAALFALREPLAPGSSLSDLLGSAGPTMGAVYGVCLAWISVRQEKPG